MDKPVIRKKVCMLGAYAVGKTSLVQRFVKDIFSEHYQTTVGVKITKKELELDGVEMSLLLWDLHGDDEFQTVRDSYLQGASGALLVADGTRPATIDQAVKLRARLHAIAGEVPSCLLLNKSDLEDSWEVTEERLRNAGFAPEEAITTSAKTGNGVEAAFLQIARRMTEG